MPLDGAIGLAGASGLSGLAVRAFAVPGKVPLYLEAGGQDPGLSEAGDAVGLELIDTAARTSFFFIPGCAVVTEALRRRLAGSAPVFFDGTLWRDDEMIRMGVGEKTGRRMGHISMSGASGAIAAFGDLAVRRRIFIHINNTNPVLFENSPERHEARGGWLGDRFRRDGGAAMSPTLTGSDAGRTRQTLLTSDQLEAELRAIGAERYHNRHPFHRRLHGGKLDRGPGAGLGAQPLLLPDADPEPRTRSCRAPADRRSCAANGGGACSTMTATTTGDGGIARWLHLTTVSGSTATM